MKPYFRLLALGICAAGGLHAQSSAAGRASLLAADRALATEVAA